MLDLVDYYTEMHAYTVSDAAYREYSGFGHAAIHRPLASADGTQFSPDIVHELILPFLPLASAFDGLDAGCGYGGTCLRLAELAGGHWHGITIAPIQVELARARAAELGRSGQVSFDLASYDAPLEASFDAIVCIESLAHSPNPAHSIANLGRHLRPGGRLIVVDDMPEPDRSREHSSLLAAFKRYWRCPVLASRAALLLACERAGLRLVADRDLTSLTRPRGTAELDAAWLCLLREHLEKTGAGFGRLAEGELGGLILERLLGAGAVRYRLLVAEASA